LQYPPYFLIATYDGIELSLPRCLIQIDGIIGKAWIRIFYTLLGRTVVDTHNTLLNLLCNKKRGAKGLPNEVS
jgi:hypothetical protein